MGPDPELEAQTAESGGINMMFIIIAVVAVVVIIVIVAVVVFVWRR